MLTLDPERGAVEGEDFSRLLDLCFRHCDFFSFTVCGIRRKEGALQGSLTSICTSDRTELTPWPCGTAPARTG